MRCNKELINYNREDIKREKYNLKLDKIDMIIIVNALELYLDKFEKVGTLPKYEDILELHKYLLEESI